MKNDRQNQLLQIISEEIIETQEQLLERLQAKGIKSTQIGRTSCRERV